MSADIDATDSGLEELADRAVTEWAGSDAKMSKLADLGGYSSAQVLAVDIQVNKDDLGVVSGQYVLKLSGDQSGVEEERSCHIRASDKSTEFSQRHIVHLLKSHSDEAGMAILYDIAGRSRLRYSPLSEQLDRHGMLEQYGINVTKDLLEAWSDDSVADEPVPLGRILEMWLGNRLDPKKGQVLHDLVRDTFGEERERTCGHKCLINPLWLCKNEDTAFSQPEVFVRGLVHGDLHPGNVLVNRGGQKPDDYYLIDFATASDKPLGFDQAYFEAAILLEHLRGKPPEQLIGILSSVEELETGSHLPSSNVAIADAVRKMRHEIVAWTKKTHPLRVDPLEKQFALARVAAGLNWAGKRKLDKPTRILGLHYAAWSARCYLEQFHPSFWKDFDAIPQHIEPSVGDSSDQLWNETWELLEGYAPDAARFVLIAGKLTDNKSLQCLGLLPWSAIIDLDANSDCTGLHRHAAETLRTLRNVAMVSERLQDQIHFSQSTAWMMAGGWTSHSQPPSDLDTWRRTRLPRARGLLSLMYEKVTPEKLRVVLLNPSTSEEEEQKLRRLVEAVDEACKGNVVILQVGGQRALVEGLATLRHIPMHVADFVERIHTIFGDHIEGTRARIPRRSSEGSAPTVTELDLDKLRLIQEDMSILHSAILSDPGHMRYSNDSAFWQGSPPTWWDLSADVDVKRDLEFELSESTESALSEGRNFTIPLFHRPGAGGTTLALRVAWNLRKKYPVAVLQRWSSQGTASRLEQLFHTSGLPVLLVADSNILSSTEREELYREMRNRNCRVVLLYVQRTLSKRNDMGAGLFLSDSMAPEESQRFLEAYTEQTDHPDRKRELERLTENNALERYRSPFFYGLIAFGSQYQVVTRYVREHLGRIPLRTMQTMRYLSLVTLYSKNSIHVDHLRRLLTQSTETSNSDVLSLLQRGPSQLISHVGGRIRVMHPVLAHEILFQEGESLAKADLTSLSLEFISDVEQYLDIDSDDVQEFLQSLFITRETSLGPETKGARFADLIESVDENGARTIFVELTRACPENPHFWNHLGRHYIYCKPEKYMEAEDCLKEAIKLSPDDHLHHHTLGMVRRFLISHREKELRDRKPGMILEDIGDLFESAVACFAKVRELAPDDSHGYITQVQTTIRLARFLKERTRGKSLEELTNESDELRDWIGRHLTTAESLLEQSRALYGQMGQEKYSHRLRAELNEVYGDLDGLIAAWELRSARQGGSSVDRRALTYAYILKHERRFRQMSSAELERIAELMESNLRIGRTGGDDFRNWFDAYRYLPRFSMDEAIHRLRSWAEQHDSAQAYLYLYVLHYLEWQHGTIANTDLMQGYLERCRALAVGRRSHVHEWLGHHPEWCPLVPFNEVGGIVYDSESQSRLPRYHSQLARVNGYVSEGPIRAQSGKLTIDGAVDAFFVPGTTFWQANEEVNFYLGFSYDGLRAWDVQKGWENEDSTEYADRTESSGGRIEMQLDQELARKQTALLTEERVGRFLNDLLQESRVHERLLSAAEVKERVLAVFGADDLHARLGFGSFEDLVNSLADTSSVEIGDAMHDGGSSEACSQERVLGSNHQTGRITKLCAPIYGFIRDDAEVDRYFKLSDVLNRTREELSIDQQVEFEPIDFYGKPRAEEVRVVAESRRLKGTIVRCGARGFGFIRDADGVERLFFLQDVENTEEEDIQVGAAVEFRPIFRRDRPAAADVLIAENEGENEDFPFM